MSVDLTNHFFCQDPGIFIFREFILNEMDLKIRSVCKTWKRFIDEKVLPFLFKELKHNIFNLLTPNTLDLLGLKKIICSFFQKMENIRIEIKHFQEFTQELAKPLCRKKTNLIVSAQHIQFLCQENANFYHFWNEINQYLNIPSEQQNSLQTVDQIREWIANNSKQLSLIDYLDLSDKGLTALPSEMRFLTGLTGLNLSENILENLPPWIGELTQLETLELTNNEAKNMSLPMTITHLDRLKWINLQGTVVLQPEIMQCLQKKSVKVLFP